MQTPATLASLREIAEQSNAWPFEEARKIVARLKKFPKQEVIFETGYGPSGLPHIGTFGEVARTTMVRHAFRVLTDDKIKTRLIAFSDDMDGLRKVPDNVPNKDLLAQHLGKPLTKVPDPFGTHPSFGEHNNARLRAFLDTFGFEYEFMSSTDCYTSGRFDAALLTVLARFDQVMEIMLPSLREERAATYSPFLPICPRTGIVLQVPIVARDAKAGTISYDDPDTGERMVTPVTGGRCKLQWKPDWAMRWVALGIDYEMAGKDLIDSVKLSGEICRALGGTPPEGFNYELFLDDTGQKISKSKGNGLTIDEWLRYASPESLSLFMYREPKSAKRLYFDVIPRHVDEYYQFLDGYNRQDTRQRLSNPVWHIHAGNPPPSDMPISFNMLLSLVTASNAENAETLWGFIGRYRPGVTPQTHPKLNALVDYAIHYFRDFVQPTKKFREPTEAERVALNDLRDALSNVPASATAEEIQDVVYEIGRREPFLDQKKKAKDGKPGVSLDWFNMLYQVLLGQEKGPRFGSFVAVYGVKNTIDMIDGALARTRLPCNPMRRLLARPHDTRDPQHVVHAERALAMFRVERAQFDRLRRLALEFLRHHLAVLGLDDDAIAAPHRRCRRNDDDVAVTIGRLHRIARHFERVGMLIIDRGKRDFVPAGAGRKSGVVEIAAGARFGETDQWHRLGWAMRFRDQIDELIDRGVGRAERLGDRFRRRPAGAAFRRDALRLVERRRIESRALRKAGG